MSGRTISYLVAPNGTENEPEGELPAGIVTQYAGTTAPAGWLFCDGANYLPTDYPALFRAIGQNFSAGTSNNGVLGSIEVGSPYSFTGTTITISSFGPQVNFYINNGCVVTLSGSSPATGAFINGLKIRITSAPSVGTTGGTFIGTFLDVPTTASGTGVSGTFMDMLRVSFQVPDTTGFTIRGAQGGESPFNIGERGGNDNVNITPQNLPSHGHGIPGAAGEGYTSFSSNGVGYGGSGSIASTLGSQTKTNAIVYTSTGTVATASGASGTVLAVTNPYVTISSIIKT
jgi:microcystin-dependent protein